MRLIFFLAVSLGMIFSSCYTPRFAYSPTAHNVPVLTEKNDSKLAINYSTNADSRKSDNKYRNNKANGYDIQAAYAITEHVGFQGNYFARNEKTYSNSSDNIFDSSVINYNRHLVELGIGYFTQIDTKQKVMFQVFAGAGFGKFNFTDKGKDINQILYSRFHNADITKFYIEPAIIFRNRSFFTASISTRFSLINFRNIRTNYTQSEKEYFKLDSINRYTSIFFEPAFVNSYGFNKLPGVRIEYQVGLSLLMGSDFLDYRRFNFSIGLVFDLPKLIGGTANKNSD